MPSSQSTLTDVLFPYFLYFLYLYSPNYLYSPSANRMAANPATTAVSVRKINFPNDAS